MLVFYFFFFLPFLLLFSVSLFSAQCTMFIVYLLGLTKRGLTNIGNYVPLWHSLPSKVCERPESREITKPKNQETKNEKQKWIKISHICFFSLKVCYHRRFLSSIHKENKKQNDFCTVFTWFTYFLVMSATVKNENDKRKRKKLFEGTIQTI